MRIASVITSFTAGGAEVLVSNLSGAFVREGHSSAVAALSPASAIGNDPQTERIMQEKIRAAGGSDHCLGLRDRRNIIAGALSMRRFMRSFKPDVIHAHTARAIPLLWLAGVRVPVVLTHHNSRLTFSPALFRIFDLVADTYIGISEACQQLIAAHTAKPVIKIVNATGPGFLATGRRMAPAVPASILAVGALTEQKNYGMMIDAMVRTRSYCPDAQEMRLRIAGNGALKPELQRKIRESGAEDMIELLGDRSDIPELMRKADLFVNTSHYEGMPIAVLEALQSALPVVATDVAGTRELIRSGENGTLVSQNDPDAFAKAICDALSDPKTYGHLSDGALREGSKYRLEHCTNAHLDLYRRLVSSR